MSMKKNLSLKEASQGDENKRLQEVEQRKKLNESNIDHPISLDDESSYNLPKKSKVSANNLYHARRQEVKDTSQEIKDIVQKIDKILEEHLYTWENVDKWSFKLPHTMFTGNEAPIQFFQPQAKIGTYDMKKLTAEQCEQIKQQGEFKVQGENENELTTWKLNSWIIRGEEFITSQFQKALGAAWHQIIQMKCRIAPKYARNYDFKYQIANPNIVDGFKSIFATLSKILNLTIGMRKVEIFNKNQIIMQLLNERLQATIKQNHQQLRVNFFEFIFKSQNYNNKKEYNLNENQKKEFENKYANFKQLFTDFDKWANKYQTEKIKELEKSDRNEDEALMEIFQEKQKHLFNLIQSSLYLHDKETQQHLINLIQATQITNRYYYEFDNEYNKKKQEKTEEIRKKHPIKSRVDLWRSRVVKEEMQPIIDKMIVDCNQKILKGLQERNLKSEVILFVRFIEFQQAYKQIYNDNKKRIQSQSTVPSRIFSTFQQYMEPYEIKQKKDEYDGRTYFEYVKGKYYETKTDFFGWRIVLQIIRYKVWTVNVFINLYDNLINSKFGLKALFKLEPFCKGKYLDSYTGVEKSNGNNYPYVIVLKRAIHGIQKAIADFEAQPDRGIFGKNFARVFKYIECYIFRLLFVTIFIIGIGMPIAITINSLLSFFLAITSWLWIPITLTFRWLYHIFIWDFDSPTRKGIYWYNYPSYSLRYQTFEKSPILKGAIEFILGLLQIFTSLLSMIIIHPLLAIISCIFAFVRRFLTTFSDKLMCFVTRKIGRQPEIDTFIAWKVRGTGVTRQYTYSIDIEDVKFLMRGYLEQIELEEYQTRLSSKINGPNQVYEDISRSIFKHYDISQSSNSFISQNISKLRNVLDEQLRERRKMYPKLPNCNIKFTEEELSNIFYSCENMTKQFIEVRKMTWVFNKFSVEENDFKSLTEAFLIKMFNDSDILYPISEIDKRIEIKTVKKSQFNSISQAIEGQTHLKTYAATIKQKFQKFKKTCLFPFVGAENVLDSTLNAIRGATSYSKYSNPSAVTYYFSPKLVENALADKDSKTKKSE